MDLTATMFAVDGGNLIAVTLRDVRERVEAERERERLLTELQDALAKVRTLSGLLPICAACKRVRDDQGYWTQIEEYVRDHSEADFSHGFCPSCAEKYFPSESSPEAAD